MGGTPAPKTFPTPGAIGTSQAMNALTGAATPQVAPPTSNLAAPKKLTTATTAGSVLPQNPYSNLAKSNLMWKQNLQGSPF